MELIRRCQAGDEEAFAALFNKYKNLVYRTAYLMLDSPEDAEDVLQEVFLQVYRSLPSFDPSKGSFTTWLYRATVNHCLSRLRRRRFLTVSLEKVPPSALTGNSSPQDRLEEGEAVRQALTRLSEKLRVVVILRYYLDLSYAEIAQILDIPVGTVKSRLDLALRTLRRELRAVPGAFPAEEMGK